MIPVPMFLIENLTKSNYNDGNNQFFVRDIDAGKAKTLLVDDLGLGNIIYENHLYYAVDNYYDTTSISNNFILNGTETNMNMCNIASYSYPMRTLQFYINMETKTWGRPFARSYVDNEKYRWTKYV